jgi:hypothetical protein
VLFCQRTILARFGKAGREMGQDNLARGSTEREGTEDERSAPAGRNTCRCGFREGITTCDHRISPWKLQVRPIDSGKLSTIDSILQNSVFWSRSVPSLLPFVRPVVLLCCGSCLLFA